jgi:rhodanese-related sulfurtransferase
MLRKDIMEKRPLVLNVLDSHYARDCMIKGSHSAPLESLEEFVKEMPRSTEIIVYCARYGCPLSRQAWELLTSLGFTNVRAYEGGMKEWVQHGLPTEGACEMEYLKGEVENPSPEKSVVQVISVEELQAVLGA